MFPGNTQGRHINESGAKGCTLVTVEDGRCTAVEHRDLDVVRWRLCEIDISAADSTEDCSPHPHPARGGVQGGRQPADRRPDSRPGDFRRTCGA